MPPPSEFCNLHSEACEEYVKGPNPVCSFPDVNNHHETFRLASTNQRLYFAGVPDRDAKFQPVDVAEPENVELQQEKYRNEELPLKGKQVKLYQAIELDDESADPHSYPVLREDQFSSLDSSATSGSLESYLQEESNSTGIRSGGLIDDSFEHEVADNLAREIRKTPQDDKHSANVGTGFDNVISQNGDVNQDRSVVVTQIGSAKKNDTGEDGGGSEEHKSSKENIPEDDDLDDNGSEDVEMSTESNESDRFSSAEVNDQSLAHDASESRIFSQDKTVRQRWDEVKIKRQISQESLEKAKKEYMKTTHAVFSELPQIYQRLTVQVSRMVSHSAYCQQQECRQGNMCGKIRNDLIPHILHHDQQSCALCKWVNIALRFHALQCQVAGSCDVWKCADTKQSILDAAWKRELAKGTVLYSTTNIWKRDEIIFENEDFDFLVKKTIGQGTFGKVHRAWICDYRTSCEADVAVKETGYDVRGEADIVRMLGNGHPNILQTQCIISLDNRDNFGLVIMELCECSLLDYLYDYIEQYNTQGLPLADAVYYFEQVVDAAAYMHSKRIVHKDLKAKNIFMTQHFQRIKIGDWDAAVFLEDELTQANLAPKGTPGYAAPEVVNRDPHGFPADIFSLGCCLLELLLGSQYKITTESRQKEIELLATVNQELAVLVGHCVADDPKDRPTARNILRDEAIKKNRTENKPVPPEPFRMAGKHITEKLSKVSMEEMCCPAIDSNRIAALHTETDDSLLRMMDTLPKELPPIHGPSTSSWGVVIEKETVGNDHETLIDSSEDDQTQIENLRNSMETMEIEGN